MAKYQLGIIYLLRDRFQIFVPGLPSILEFRFVPEIIRDLDVVDRELLYNLLKIFITTNNIPKSSLIIVISDSASIMKDFVASTQQDQQAMTLDQLQDQVNEFLEHIPFEEISSKSIPIPNGIRAYGTNKDLYESVKESFIQEGFEVISALPAVVIGPEVSTKAVLDADAINAILKKALSLSEFNFLKQSSVWIQSEESEIENNEGVKKEKKPDKKKIIILVGVFIVLLIVLVIVFISQPKI